MGCTLLRGLILILLSLCLGAWSTPGRADDATADTWYAEKITAGDVPVRIEHMWSKGARFHSYTVVAGRPIVTLVDPTTYYALDPFHLKGMAVARSPGSIRGDARRQRPMGREGAELLEKGAEVVRKERMRGRECDVLRLTDPTGRHTVWVTRDELRVPLRVEVFDRQSKKTVNVDYLEWSQGFMVPDSFFAPDTRIDLERLTYEQYMKRAANGSLPQIPVLYRDLLHGPKRD